MDGALAEPVADTVKELDDRALIERLSDLEVERRRLEAETAAVLAEQDGRRVYRADGHATMWGLLRATVGWSDRECRERMRIARLLADFPAVAELFADGRLPVANVAEIARGYANPRCGTEIVDVIGTLVVEAGRLEFDDFRIVVRTWERLADVDGAHRDALENHARRNAGCQVFDGVGHLSANLGELDGLTVREIFEQFVQSEWNADWAATVDEHGDQACSSLMPRSAAQRRADAVVTIFKSAAAAAPGAKRPRPVVNVFVDYRTFLDLLVEHDLIPRRPPDLVDEAEPRVTERRCRTEHGDPVDARTAVQIALHELVRFVVLDDEGVPIRWGRARRLFNGAARDAVMSLSPRCTAPGCRVPARRCDADHTKPWSKGGLTDPANGGPGCRRHNLLKNHGFTTHRDTQGRWHHYRPDGTEIP